MTASDQLVYEKAHKAYWLCFILTLANLAMSVYCLNEAKVTSAAWFFLGIGAISGLGAWLNAKVCKALEDMDNPDDFGV